MPSTSKPIDNTARASEIHWLSAGTFELACRRPAGFTFSPGQRLRITLEDEQRDYSLISAPEAPHLRLCIRRIKGGKMSAHLSKMTVGAALKFSGPCGYVTFKPSKRPAVFFATGTGIVPFVAMVRGGVSDFILLHGVRQGSELYYKEEPAAAARRHIPCITEEPKSTFGLRPSLFDILQFYAIFPYCVR